MIRWLGPDSQGGNRSATVAVNNAKSSQKRSRVSPLGQTTTSEPSQRPARAAATKAREAPQTPSSVARPPCLSASKTRSKPSCDSRRRGNSNNRPSAEGEVCVASMFVEELYRAGKFEKRRSVSLRQLRNALDRRL